MAEQFDLFGGSVETQPPAPKPLGGIDASKVNLPAYKIKLALDMLREAKLHELAVFGPQLKPVRFVDGDIAYPLPPYEAEPIAVLYEVGYLKLGAEIYMICNRREGRGHRLLLTDRARRWLRQKIRIF